MDKTSNLSEPKQVLKNINCQEKHVNWISLLHSVSLTIYILERQLAVLFSTCTIKKLLQASVSPCPATENINNTELSNRSLIWMSVALEIDRSVQITAAIFLEHWNRENSHLSAPQGKKKHTGICVMQRHTALLRVRLDSFHWRTF